MLAAGDTYEAGNTGGAANHTLTVDEMPSHSHTFTGSSVNTGNNSVGHTHTYTDYYATTTGSATLSVANLASHNHGVTDPGHAHAFKDWLNREPGGQYYCASYEHQQDVGGGTASAKTGISINNNGSGTGHTHSGANTSTTRTSNGISANHTHSVTAKGSNSNTGGGSTFSIMPPYLAVYMWKRTA